MPQPRIHATVVCVVGSQATHLIDAVGGDTNCRAVSPEEHEPLDRAVAAWREATGAHLPWLLHDADPLAAVAEAYRAQFDEHQHGALEVAIHQTLVRWRAGSLSLPDYYVVAEPHELATTTRHLYLGALHDERPARVQPLPADPEQLRRRLPRLRATRWWPELDELLDRLTRRSPDELPHPVAVDDPEAASGLVR